jgi:3'-phosphoadenosine 5'-phosphosulfate sulfotransferase (PAPS reductase)/FAD synthetase
VLDRELTPEGWWIVRPLAAWSAADVFQFLADRNIEPNPLYRLGMKRVGCMPCINCGKDELLEISKRFPEHIDKVREWETLVSLASKRGWTTFFTDGADDDESDEEIFARLKIDERIKWSKTSRGGKQYDMLRLAPAAACSSSYGLCE